MSLSPSQIRVARLQVQDWMGDVLAVETYQGEGSFGPSYAASANVTCNIDDERKLVVGKDGVELEAALTIQVAVTDEAKFTPESRVTHDGRMSKVVSAVSIAFKGQDVYAEVTTI